MSILAEMLLEEYERCSRHKQARKDDLHRHPKGSQEYIQIKQIIRTINKDMWMLWRALVFQLLRYKWKKGKE